MLDRITATAKAFEDIATGNEFHPQTKIIFSQGADLLEQQKLIDLNQRQKRCDAILVGTLFCALFYDISQGKVEVEKLQKTYGLVNSPIISFNDLCDMCAMDPLDEDIFEKLIPIVGRKILFGKSLPLSTTMLTNDGILGKTFQEFIEGRVENYNKMQEQHEELYVKAHKHQERYKIYHKIYHALGLIGSALAIFIPPLALIPVINYMLILKKEDKVKLSWEEILMMTLAAITPIFSGIVSGVFVSKIAAKHRQDDLIKRTNIHGTVFDYYKMMKKETEQYKKRQSDPDLWELCKNSNKPKKVMVPYKSKGIPMVAVYMDVEQTDRVKKRMNYDRNFTPNIFQESQRKSIAINAQLETKYSNRTGM